MGLCCVQVSGYEADKKTKTKLHQKKLEHRITACNYSCAVSNFSKIHSQRTQLYIVYWMAYWIGSGFSFSARGTNNLIQRPCYQRGSLCQDPAGN